MIFNHIKQLKAEGKKIGITFKKEVQEAKLQENFCLAN